MYFLPVFPFICIFYSSRLSEMDARKIQEKTDQLSLAYQKLLIFIAFYHDVDVLFLENAIEAHWHFFVLKHILIAFDTIFQLLFIHSMQ